MNRIAHLYPLLFHPVFKERVWGGRRLASWFPDLPDGPIGEAWLLSNHPQGPTRVSNGQLAGCTLPDLALQYGTNLLGTSGISGKTGEFPLLFKLLDAQTDLSVQVHPPDEYKGLPPGELGKAEVWVVLQADPGARAIYGLKPDTTPAALSAAIASGQTMAVLNQIQVSTGDVLFVPPGMIHALGAGLLVAEIQQSSDTVYRVYDYDRPGLDGKRRDLHIDHALRVSRYGPPPHPGRLPPTPSPNIWIEICRSPHFTVAYGQSSVDGQWVQRASPHSFQAMMILSGSGTVTWPGGSEPLQVRTGDTLLLPASLDGVAVTGAVCALLTSVPL